MLATACGRACGRAPEAALCRRPARSSSPPGFIALCLAHTSVTAASPALHAVERRLPALHARAWCCLERPSAQLFIVCRPDLFLLSLSLCHGSAVAAVIRRRWRRRAGERNAAVSGASEVWNVLRRCRHMVRHHPTGGHRPSCSSYNVEPLAVSIFPPMMFHDLRQRDCPCERTCRCFHRQLFLMVVRVGRPPR